MSLKAPVGKKKEKLPLIEAGLQRGVCYCIVDIGTQETPFLDDDGNQKHVRQVTLGWEVTDVRMPKGDDRPRVMSKTFTLSLHEKATLRKWVHSWRGAELTDDEAREFDLRGLLGAKFQLQVMQRPSKKTGEPYSYINSVLPPAKGQDNEAENELLWFSLDEDEPLPETKHTWLIESIQKSPEWKAKDDMPYEASDDDPPEEEEDGGDLPF